VSDLLDSVIGAFHFITDMPPRNVPIVDPKPRHANPWQRNGQVIVSKVVANGDVKASIEKSLALLGNLGQAIGKGDKVLVKPNFNSPDPLPAATDPAFLRAVVQILLEAGAKVTIGESSGGLWRPTRKVFRKLGVSEIAHDLGVDLFAFEDKPKDWVHVKIGGDYMSTIFMPRSAYEADKIVYLPCMKTHSLGGFSGALKLTVGFVHPGQRRTLHAGNLEQKVAEISLCWQPDLIIMDGRKAFISGGPNKGKLADPEPGLLFASGDPVAIDVEGMKVILSYKAKNKIPSNPWQSAQITAALKHGLGVGKGGYVVVE
jgi:uncharacterized protein (DUF362 family)